MSRHCRLCKKDISNATRKERIIGYCKACAEKARDEGFGEMAKGNLKKGLGAVFEMTGLKKNSVMEEKIKAALTKKRRKIEKKLRKQGLSETEITEGLKKFDESFSK